MKCARCGNENPTAACWRCDGAPKDAPKTSGRRYKWEPVPEAERWPPLPVGASTDDFALPPSPSLRHNVHHDVQTWVGYLIGIFLQYLFHSYRLLFAMMFGKGPPPRARVRDALGSEPKPPPISARPSPAEGDAKVYLRWHKEPAVDLELDWWEPP
jgi:hypothetical protein